MMSEQPTEPTRPASIPNYIGDGLDRQDADTLREIAEYCLDRAAWLERDVEPEDVVDEDEELVDVEDGEKGTIVLKKIPCGKDCNGCPHGPYKYRGYRDGDTVKTEYLGRA